MSKYKRPTTEADRTVCADRTHLPIIVGVTLDDCAAYATATSLRITPGSWRAVTLRVRHGARGWTGPVYMTPAARAHDRGRELLEEARPSGLTCICTYVGLRRHA